ncbi:SpoIIE family protein phosphatase [Quadrisphaera sp. KR29]|uniref:SpoIIE family protein phosphatase n=1 Tax=Quadrisphaera sp. KR29 TaxID=3461391 RepID=UPI0040449014
MRRLAALATSSLRTASAQVVYLGEVQTAAAASGAAEPSVAEPTALTEAVSTLVVVDDGPVVVCDAARDSRVADLEPVRAGVVGACLGVALSWSSGEVVGALCVFDHRPRQWSEDDVAVLVQLAEFAVLALEPTAATDDDARRVLHELSVAAAGVGTFDWDLTTGRLAWDDRLVELFGYRRGEFGESIEDFNARVHPDDLPHVSGLLQTAIASGGTYEATYRVVIPGRRPRWVAARGRALRDPSGAAARLLGAAWDATASHEAVAEVAAVVEDLAVGFFALDRAWNFTQVNAEAELLLERSREELVGRNVWEQFPAAIGSPFETHYRSAMATQVPARFDAYYPAPLDAWYEVRAVPTADGLSVYFLNITDRRLAHDRAQAAAERARLLGSITEELLRADEPTQAAERLAKLVVPVLADWAVVTLAEDSAGTGSRRGLQTAGAAHVDPASQQLVETYASNRLQQMHDDSVVVRTMQTAQAEYIESGATPALLAMLDPGPAYDAMAALAPEHVAVHPLTGRNGTVGILSLCRAASRGPFSGEDRAVALHVAARAGIVLDNARLYRQQRDLAEALQRSLLTEPPESPNMHVVVRYTPAAETAQVGGDWYDAFLQPDGATVLVIGDVVGHDTQAAAAMSQVRTLLRGLGAQDGAGPAELLANVDAVMQTLRVGTTATAVVARVEQTEEEGRRGVGRLRWSNAGHPPVMVIYPDATVAPLSGKGADLLLGVIPSVRRHEHEVTLEPGAVVLFYTDGLVERRGQSLDVGLQRLEEVLTELAGDDLETLCDQVLARMLPQRPEDDVALVALRLHAEDAPRPTRAGART